MKSIIFICFVLMYKNLWASEKLTSFLSHDGLTINGNITYPDDLKTRRPGVLLLHGSGPMDMNCWLPGSVTADGKPTKIFEDLSKALNQGGAVVYRYNKRGVSSNGDNTPTIDQKIFSTGSVPNLILDAKQALQVLLNDDHVDKTKIYILGMSEGSILAPMIAQDNQNIKGLILLSSVGRTMGDIIYFQNVENTLKRVRKHFDLNHDEVITSDELVNFPDYSQPLSLADINNDGNIALSELSAMLIEKHYQSIAKYNTGYTADWFQSLLSLPPNYQNINKFKGSILLLHGELDTQTPIDDLYLIERSLKKSLHNNYKIYTYPELGHGFSPLIGPHKMRSTVGPVDKLVLEDLTKWMIEQ